MIVDKEPEDAAESVGDEGEEGGVIGFCCRCWFGYTLPPVLSDSAKVDVAAGVSGAMVETEVELKLCVDMEVDGVEVEDMVIIGEGKRIPSSMEGFAPLPGFP